MVLFQLFKLYFSMTVNCKKTKTLTLLTQKKPSKMTLLFFFVLFFSPDRDARDLFSLTHPIVAS